MQLYLNAKLVLSNAQSIWKIDAAEKRMIEHDVECFHGITGLQVALLLASKWRCRMLQLWAQYCI